MHHIAPVVELAALLCILPLRAQTTVTLAPTASPATGQPSSTVVTVTGSNFPAGVILPANVTINLAPATIGRILSAQTVAVHQLFGTTEQVSFTIPPVALAAPANYLISIAGSTQTGATFASGNTAAVIINPVSTIASLSPSQANANQRVQVAITGRYTNFVQGATRASFGPGISVGGASVGQAGPVTVTGPTTATADLIIDASAFEVPRTVNVTTGLQLASLKNGFLVETPVAYVNVDMTTAAEIAPGISGFNDEHLITGVEYYDPKFVAAVQALKPGWIGFPGGTPAMAFDWQTGFVNKEWVDDLTNGDPAKVDPFTGVSLRTAQILTQAAGGVFFSDFAIFAKSLQASAIVCFNGYTDNHPGSASKLEITALHSHVHTIEWELANEPYSYPAIFPTPSAYAAAMYNPYFQDISAIDHSATVGLFYQGEYDIYTSPFMVWDSGMSAYTPEYWNGVSTHVYPIIDPDISIQDEEETLNGVLAHGTNEYISSYLVPLIGANTPIFITEVNSAEDKAVDVPPGPNIHPHYTGTMAFQSYLYNGIFLAEYVTRMAAVPHMKAVGVTSLYLGNEFNNSMVRAFDDYQGYLAAQVKKNPNFSTNTATNPYTQFEFYTSAPGLAVAVVNQAINSSTHIWKTTIFGGPTVPIHGFDHKPIPAVYAQAFMGNGTNYLIVTNKSNTPVPVQLAVNGSPRSGTLMVSYVTNPSGTAENTAINQNNVQIVEAESANPITVGPYSVTRVEF